ncbi:MAG TPA: MEDS domain-containing protein [Vicinamibacterales bacterium]
MTTDRKSRPTVQLGIHAETVSTGDHLALFYESDAEFSNALGFIETGLRGTDHCIVFGIAADTDRMLAVLRDRLWDVDGLVREGRLSVLRPEVTCDDTVAAVSRHFEHVLGNGATFIRFLGNAAVGRAGWPTEEEFYRLEATVSAATLDLPCVAICMFDLRTQSAHTIMKAAFEGHPVTIHRNCIRENPLYVPRAERA